MRLGFLLVILLAVGLPVKSVFAQNQWPPARPRFPAVCTTLYAGQQGQPALQDALNKCPAGQAVELAMGATEQDDSFLTGPITLKQGVSLIVDGGVTLYGSTDASLYQTAKPSDWPSSLPWTCGTVGIYPVIGPCLPLISFSKDSGVYGYGVIDAQGNKPIGVNGLVGPSWWDLITRVKKDCTPDPNITVPKGTKACQEASPPMISVGYDAKNAGNLVLYKITLRNPAYHMNRLEGSYITVWGVKLQAPWNIPNTDGFDIGGDHIWIKDSVIANGDQDIALGSSDNFTHDVVVEGLRAYAKGGIAFLTEGPGFQRVVINDFAMTGDLPSVVIGPGAERSSVNGVSDDQMKAKYGVRFYQAVPSATGETQGLQVFAPISTTTQRQVQDILFNNVCMDDLVVPLNLTTKEDPGADAVGGGTDSYAPVIGPLWFTNIHVLPPGPQFIMPGSTAGTWDMRKFDVYLEGNSTKPNKITLVNFVFGDGQAAGDLFEKLDAEHNKIWAVSNVYPALFNQMDDAANEPSFATFDGNHYLSKAGFTSPNLAYGCSANLFPFITGELYAGLGAEPTGSHANLQSAKVVESSAVTLFAVVQPAMSQESYFVRDSYNNHPGLLAVGSPPLKGEVMFYDNGRYIGNAELGANGTLAELRINNIGAGIHVFTAVYADPPKAGFYRPFGFGGVTVAAGF